MSIVLPKNFPNVRPKIKFETQIYHPNVSDSGNISLGSSWTAQSTIKTLLSDVHHLMLNPNLDDPMAPEIAHMWTKDYYLALELAKEWTIEYA